MTKMEQIADEADVIICGYAMKQCEEGIRVFNLNNGHGAAVFSRDGVLIETNMNDIELAIAKKHMLQSLRYLEGGHAEVLSV